MLREGQSYRYTWLVPSVIFDILLGSDLYACLNLTYIFIVYLFRLEQGLRAGFPGGEPVFLSINASSFGATQNVDSY